MKKLNKKGFTLVEMLVVIAIIAVLVAIIVPTTSSATNKAKAAANAANLRSVKAEIGIALLQEDVDAIGTITPGTNGAATVAVGTGTTISVPAAKSVSAVDGGSLTFAASISGGEVIVSYGTNGTIDRYAAFANGETVSAPTT